MWSPTSMSLQIQVSFTAIYFYNFKCLLHSIWSITCFYSNLNYSKQKAFINCHQTEIQGSFWNVRMTSEKRSEAVELLASTGSCQFRQQSGAHCPRGLTHVLTNPASPEFNSPVQRNEVLAHAHMDVPYAQWQKSQQTSHIVWLHLYEPTKRGQLLRQKTEGQLPGAGRREGWGDHSWGQLPFGGNENVLKLVRKVTQLCDYTKTTEAYTFKRVNFRFGFVF